MGKRRGSGDGSIERRGKNRYRVPVELGRDPTNEITTGEWLARWLEERVRDQAIGPAVAYNYDRILRKHLIPALGSVRLQDLRADQIRDLKTKLSQSCKPGTVRKILGVLRQALQAAVTQQLLASNPASAVPSPSLRRDRKEPRALDEQEIKQLLRAAKGTPFAAVIRFALATGVRQGELLGAIWDAIDLERGEFRVVQTLQIVNGEFQILPPKTDRGRRTITLSPETVELLRTHRKQQNAARLKLGLAWKDHGLVFPDDRGGYWERRNFYKGFRRLVERSPIENPEEIMFHSLRHTAASQWIRRQRRGDTHE